MFERFTDRGRQVVVLAQEEARRLNHNYIGTEHILLGLLREGDGVAAKTLAALGIRLDPVRDRVESIIGRGQQEPSGHIPFTPRAKKVVELSIREADALGSRSIGTEHILLGLLREGNGVAAQVLMLLGADLSRVRQQVIQLLAPGQHPDAAGAGAKGADAAGASASGADTDPDLARIDALDRRLTALERWAGLRPDPAGLDEEIAQARRVKEAAIERQDFEAAVEARGQEQLLLAARADREKAGPGTGRPALAEELGQLKAELDRLRAILREHGIAPDDGDGQARPQ